MTEIDDRPAALWVLPDSDDTVDINTCYLPQCVMSTLNLTIGQPIQVLHEPQSAISCVWPLQGVHGDFIQFSNVVSLKTECLQSGQDLSKRVPLCHIIPQLSKNCSSVSVEIIFTKLSDVFKFRNQLKSGRLFKFVANILRNMYIVDKCTINCHNMKLAKLYGIYMLIISSAEPYVNKNTCLKIISKTDIIVENIMSKERYEQLHSKKNKLQPLGRISDTHHVLKDIVTFPVKFGRKLKRLGIDSPSGILLQGPSGSGKTSLVQNLAIESDCCLVVINGPEIFGSRPGESEENIRLKFEKAKLLSKEGACILFIDELDALCPRKSKTGSVHERRLVGQITAMLDSRHGYENMVVIAATNRASAIDSVLRRPGRFDKEVFIGVPTLEQRVDILKCLTRNLKIHPSLALNTVAEMTPGYVRADLVALCQEVALRQMQTQSLGITLEMFREALSLILPSIQRGSDIVVDYQPVSWDEIGGLEDVKAQIKQSVEWPLKHPESFSRLGIEPPGGVLLYGPPGCCKTTLVRAAATACHVNFFSVSGAHLFSPYVGDSERILSEAFSQARAAAPSILFIDEIDSIVGRRESTGKGQEVQERVLSTLLNQMDGVGIRLDDRQCQSSQKELEGQTRMLEMPEGGQRSAETASHGELVVAATNRPDMIDDALMRPGRFDRILYVPPPDCQARYEILKVHTKKMPMQHVDLELIANVTEFYSGADLENLCKEAALHALTVDGLDTEAVTQENFNQVLRTITPSLSENQLKRYINFKKS